MSPILWWLIPAAALAGAVGWAGVRRHRLVHEPTPGQRARQLRRAGRAIGYSEESGRDRSAAATASGPAEPPEPGAAARSPEPGST